MTIKRLITISRPIFYLPALTVFIGGFVYSKEPLTLAVLLCAVLVTFPMGLVAFGINDITDMKSDAINPRKGKTDGAVVAKNEAAALEKALIAATVISLILSLILGSLGTFSMFLLTYVLSYMYSVPPFRCKTRPIIDSTINGLWVVSIFMAGYWANASYASLHLPNLTMLLAIFIFSASVHAFGSLPDYSVDKKVGDTTIAVKFGVTYTTWFSVIGFATSLLLLWGGKPISNQKAIVMGYITLCLAGSIYAFFNYSPRTLRNLFFGCIVIVPLVMFGIAILRLTS
jgi:4-hydroxybenzoate polyprenyltransferase